MTQKILAAHAGLDTVEAGQLIEAKLDIVMANDITGPMALPIIRQMSDKVFDKDKVVFVPDHFTPNKDIKSAENSKAIREYAKEQGLKWYFEQGKSGVEHAILPEAGVVTAGECIIGADSHTCTYGALGAFSTGMGTTDVATGMATGEIWFKVPSAIKFVLTGKPGKYVSGKTYEQLKKNAAYIKWLKSGGITAFPGGEDQEEFRKRCVEGMKKQVRFLIARHVKYAAFVVHGGTIMAVMHALYEEKKDFYNWQVENGSGYLVSVSEKEWENGIELLKNAEKRSGR